MSKYITYRQDEIKLINLGLCSGQNSVVQTEKFHFIVSLDDLVIWCIW